jgi:hypothetical protein
MWERKGIKGVGFQGHHWRIHGVKKKKYTGQYTLFSVTASSQSIIHHDLVIVTVNRREGSIEIKIVGS